MKDNPVVITDIEDVNGQRCPFVLSCMRLSSTVSLTLEVGDDHQEIEAVIQNGLQASLNDGVFLNVSLCCLMLIPFKIILTHVLCIVFFFNNVACIIRFRRYPVTQYVVH